jgi:hypothetical protein
MNLIYILIKIKLKFITVIADSIYKQVYLLKGI